MAFELTSCKLGCEVSISSDKYKYYSVKIGYDELLCNCLIK